MQRVILDIPLFPGIDVYYLGLLDPRDVKQAELMQNQAVQTWNRPELLLS